MFVQGNNHKCVQLKYINSPIKRPLFISKSTSGNTLFFGQHTTEFIEQSQLNYILAQNRALLEKVLHIVIYSVSFNTLLHSR